MRVRAIVIALARVAALVAMAVAFCHHGWATGHAQEVESQTGTGLTGSIDFIVEWVEPGSPGGRAGLKGFIVESVEPGSYAEKAGIQPGDVILYLGGRRVESIQDIDYAFRNWLMDPNKAIDAVYLRYDPGAGRYKIVRTGQVTTPSTGKRTIPGDALDEEAIEKPLPDYPALAKAARVSGEVTVSVVVDEEGRVEKAEAVRGHPLLRQAAVEAASRARFTPRQQSGSPVKVSGVITYNFVLP